ncbi:class II aaRS and biotin synthetase [Tilletiaria anomala UBC 951]|uniref:Class II aaRS and biotin synthetase n=1 Tax=Tilletiaria anomala (strain ATCC 24038 / CBS 436.72 / UBC 951) TaxID=1037660 RepID=A0A066VFY1_TILAU|nr:class II aaRS and biotin synthetase [Tilletiaria anomala UBC 951]KDN37679.1 class II aaRS and biotin synthetase [Tilletiaria anomala UBC 951]
MSNILIYAGPGTSQSALSHTINTLRVLLPSYDVQTIQAKSIALDPWSSSTSLFVIPGGRDLPYLDALTQQYPLPSGRSTVSAVERINDYVRRDGGSFLGICAGAYFASSFCDFEEGTPLEVRGERPALRFFPGTCKGTVYPGFVYESDAGSRVVQVKLNAKLGSGSLAAHYNGGGAFMHAEQYKQQGIEVLARYSSDDPTIAGGEQSIFSGQPAVILTKADKGQALLFGVHPEFPMGPRSRFVKQIGDVSTLPASFQDSELQESQRLRALGGILKLLSLEVSIPESQNESAVRQHLAGLSLSTSSAKTPSITDPPRLTPLILMETESGAVHSVLESLRQLPRPPTSKISSPQLSQLTLREGPHDPDFERDALRSAELFGFKDVNDTFHIFLPTSQSATQQQTETSLQVLCRDADYQAYLTPSDSRGSPSGEEMTDQVVEVDLNAVPKYILAYPSGAYPSSGRLMPYFNAPQFIKSLAASRQLLRDAPIIASSGIAWQAPVTIASAFVYAQVVTSTQTMLDKNYKVLSRLPTGFTAIATHQVSGRGRGGNAWISPLGCLQFSSVLHLPSSLASGVVFVQYIAGLAIVLAVRHALGRAYVEVGQKIRIKWPNDVYAEVGEDAPGQEQRKGTFTVDGKRYAKLAGVLVNSQFAGKDFALVVGCGINCLNSRPTTSLSDLISIHNATLPTDRSALPLVSQEALLGAILATFEQLWNIFIKTGTFEPFKELYRDIWLHSDQEATLMDTDPPTHARIVGISSDFGMLRAVPVEHQITSADYDAWSKSATTTSPFIDLQPDGNSFDMLQNLIRRKE